MSSTWRWYRTNHDNEYRPGDLLRYSEGESALFMVENVYRADDPQHTRYYGTHCMGGIHSSGHRACERATDADYRTWVMCRKWRKP